MAVFSRTFQDSSHRTRIVRALGIIPEDYSPDGSAIAEGIVLLEEEVQTANVDCFTSPSDTYRHFLYQ